MEKVVIPNPLSMSGTNIVQKYGYTYDAPRCHEPTITTHEPAITTTDTRAATYAYRMETSGNTQGVDAIGAVLWACFNGATACETGLYYYGLRYYTPENPWTWLEEVLRK